MTADVNVTQKMEQALGEAEDRWKSRDGRSPEYDPPVPVHRLAVAALSVLSDPEVLAGMAGVLREHRAYPTGSPYCKCAWRPALSLNDTESDRQQHRDHQVVALADWLRGQG